jgi:hypothetical protein
MSIAEYNNRVIWTVCHYNKNTTTITGNVGSVVLRKSSCVTSSTKDKETKIFTVSADKIRAKDVEDFHFRIDCLTHSYGLPQIIEEYEKDYKEIKNYKEIKENSELEELFKKLLENDMYGLSYNHLQNRYNKLTGTNSNNGFSKKLNKAIELHIIRRDEDTKNFLLDEVAF